MQKITSSHSLFIYGEQVETLGPDLQAYMTYLFFTYIIAYILLKYKIFLAF